MFKIDVYPHIIPPKYMDFLYKKTSAKLSDGRYGLDPRPALHDLETRFRIMDKYENYVQILNIAIPALEDVGPPKLAAELAQIANDEMAELVMKYPERFIAAVACLPMNDIDASLNEIDRVVLDLRFRGIQIYSNIMDKPIDLPEFEPIFAKMAQYDLPVLIHPRHRKNGRLAYSYTRMPDETEGEYWGRSLYNWPF
ncbi:MAG: amidohydrolase family protein, partial [Methanotrichaceae archaeon]|nr:amidohydrolase family protein [Methanotrichaceae archaeon]